MCAAPVPAVTRDQVRAVLAAKDEPLDVEGDRWLTARDQDDPHEETIWDLDVDALTDAVMTLLAEAPQPKVLWEGDTQRYVALTALDRAGYSRIPGKLLAPVGTRVLVVEAPAPPAPEVTG